MTSQRQYVCNEVLCNELHPETRYNEVARGGEDHSSGVDGVVGEDCEEAAERKKANASNLPKTAGIRGGQHGY